MHVYRTHITTVADQLGIELRRDGFTAYTAFEHNYPVLITDAPQSIVGTAYEMRPRDICYLGERVLGED